MTIKNCNVDEAQKTPKQWSAKTHTRSNALAWDLGVDDIFFSALLYPPCMNSGPIKLMYSKQDKRSQKTSGSCIKKIKKIKRCISGYSDKEHMNTLEYF